MLILGWIIAVLLLIDAVYMVYRYSQGERFAGKWFIPFYGLYRLAGRAIQNKKRGLIKAFVFALILTQALTTGPVVSAQTEAPQIVDATMPVDTDLRSHVEAWLGNNAPVPLPYWAITYVEPQGFEVYFVSIVALDIVDPAQAWRITDNNTVAYMGTVIVYSDGTVELYSHQPTEQGTITKLAVPTEVGGGSYLRFPWRQGSAMMYGPRGVHEAGGGGAYATGFLAVDFVGGDDMGSGVARNTVYAVSAGTVDYVCSDGTSTLIRTHNEDTNDYFIYAHLLDNANLEMDHEFGSGAAIGTLKYGSFDDHCGWAEQQNDHYHLHFGFQTNNNSFRMENCILNTSSQTWNCSGKTVKTGEFLVGGGGVSSGGDDGSYSAGQPSFWDYVVIGAITIWDRAVLQNLPDHQQTEYTYVLFSTVKIMIKIARVLVYSNVNLFPLATVLLAGFYFKLLLGSVEILVFGLKAWKSLVPIWGA